MARTYIAGVTRKNNTKCSNWIAQDGKGINGWTSQEADARQFASSDEANRAAKAACDSRERPVVKSV